MERLIIKQICDRLQMFVISLLICQRELISVKLRKISSAEMIHFIICKIYPEDVNWLKDNTKYFIQL